MKQETVARAAVSAERIERGLWWERPLTLVDGCTPVSEACDHCWSARESARWPRSRRLTTDGRFTGQVRIRRDRLEIPAKRRKPTVWAVWNDLFHEDVPSDFIWQAMNAMVETPQHTYIVLTKRAERMRNVICEMLKVSMEDVLAPNIWPGVTAENQPRAIERIPPLLATPAAVRLVSVEPMLGNMDLSYNGLGLTCPTCGGTGEIEDPEHWMHPNQTGDGEGETWCLDCNRDPAPIVEGIGWIICGGESGGGARSMRPDWAKGLRDQCQVAGVPFFFKQWGEFCYPEQMSDDCFQKVDAAVNLAGTSDYQKAFRVGKKAAGRCLDGRIWDEFPIPPSTAEDAEVEK